MIQARIPTPMAAGSPAKLSWTLQRIKPRAWDVLLASARPLTLFLVTSLVSPAPWPRAEPREILPLLLPALVTGGVPQAQVVLYSETSALFAPLLNKRTGERVENT
jgi:hypothetical protein